MIHFAAAGFSLAGCLLFSFIPLYAEAGPTPDWYFSSAGNFTAWRGEGIEAGGPRPGGLQIMGGEELRLISPSGLGIPAAEKPYLRIRFRPQSPRYLRIFWIDGAGRPVLVPDAVQIPFDRNFHTRWIPLTEKREYRDTIERISLYFGGRPGWVEIDFIEVRPFSLSLYLSDQWREFWLSRHLHPGTINSLQSPQIFNKPFVTWLNKLLLIILVIGLIFYFKTKHSKRVKIATKIGLAVLIIWIIYDIRETYSMFTIAKDIYESYVKPPPAEKTFPALGDFYRMVDFAEKHIPLNESYNFYQGWPFDCRLKYYLYPRRINCNTTSNIVPGEPTPYHLIYRNPEILYDPVSRRLISREGRNRTYISAPGRIISRMGPATYIFREDLNIMETK